MIKKLLRIVLALLGASVGITCVILVGKFLTNMDILIDKIWSGWFSMMLYSVAAVIGGIVFFLLSPGFFRIVRKIEKRLQALPAIDAVVAVAGTIFGLVIAFLLSWLARMIPSDGVALFVSTLLYLTCGTVGLRVAYHKRAEIRKFFRIRFRVSDKFRRNEEFIEENEPQDTEGGLIPDSSVLVDPRFEKLLQLGFIRGNVILSSDVIRDLNMLSGSSEPDRARKGARALENIRLLRDSSAVRCIDSDEGDPALHDTEAKLIALAATYSGVILSVDYALVRSARLRNAAALSLNDLAEALKPKLAAGDPLIVQISRKGKEHGQGIAFTDDGTMIVVENGEAHLGETLSVSVVNTVQTAAGRLVFARIPENASDF